MQDTTVTTANDVLRLDDTQVRLELGRRLDRLLRRGDDETGLNVIVVDASQPESNVVTAECVVNLFCRFGEDTGDFDSTLRNCQEEPQLLNSLCLA
jgi:hypothetical protein